MTADLLPLPVSHTRKANEYALSVLLGKANEISARLVEADEGRKMEVVVACSEGGEDAR